MESAGKFILPSPNFDKVKKPQLNTRQHYLTPSGMTLLPRDRQPPPMFGPRGATIPARFLGSTKKTFQKCEKQYCEPCEMELQSKEDLHEHRRQHQRCKIDGCNYRGHPSVMDRHISSLHTSGLFEKYKKLSTPEEIAAWREERRKRYPTVANVEMRQKAQQQRQRRGERLEENKSRFGKREERRRIQRGAHAEQAKGKQQQQQQEENNSEVRANKNLRNIKRNNRRKKAKTANRQTPSTPATTIGTEIKDFKVEAPNTETYIESGMPMFKGTAQMENYKHLNTRKANDDNNALSRFLGMYESDGDDDDKSDIEECEEQVATQAAEDYSAEMPKETVQNGTLQGSSTDVCNKTENNQNNICLENSTMTRKTTMSSIMPHNASQETEEAKSSSLEQAKTNIIAKTEESLNAALEISITNNASGAELKDVGDVYTDEPPLEAPIAKSSQIPDLLPRNEPPRKRLKADEASERRQPKWQSKKLRSGLDYTKLRLRRQNTLLEKLLEPDVRHERNVLLQCVRFVCENNFLGAGQAGI